MRNLTLSDNFTHILGSWDEPAEPNGNINYTSTIICMTLHDNMTYYSMTLETLIRELTAPREPFSECEVTVTPQTGAGMGPSSVDTIQTDQEGEKQIRSTVEYTVSNLVGTKQHDPPDSFASV